MLSPFVVWDANGDLYAEFWNILFNDNLIHAYTNGRDDATDEVISLYYDVTYGKMVEITAVAAQFYLEGIAMITVGADIALAINDTFDGNLTSAGLTVFCIALPHVPGQGVIFKKGSEVLGKFYRRLEDIPDFNDIVTKAGKYMQGQDALDYLDELYESQNPGRTSYVGSSFVNNPNARRIKPTEDIIVFQYRKVGDPKAHYVTTQVLETDEARRLLALPDNNSAEEVKIYVIKKDTEITIGEVADMSGNMAAYPNCAV